MGKFETVLLVVFALIFVFSMVMLFGGEEKITGFATSGTTVSNVSVSKSFSITLSANLSHGILFGNTTTADDLNGTANYIINSGSNDSYYFVNLSTDSTVNIDLCLNADGNLTDSDSLDIILIGNESYSNASVTNDTYPIKGEETIFTFAGVKAGQTITPGNSTYYRFWLDVPAEVASGSYNNSIVFTGVEAGDACT